MAGSAAARPSLLTRGLVEIEAATPLRTGPVIGDHGGRCKVAEAGPRQRQPWGSFHFHRNAKERTTRASEFFLVNLLVVLEDLWPTHTPSSKLGSTLKTPPAPPNPQTNTQPHYSAPD